MHLKVYYGAQDSLMTRLNIYAMDSKMVLTLVFEATGMSEGKLRILGLEWVIKLTFGTKL